MFVTDPYQVFQELKARYSTFWPEDFADAWYWGPTQEAQHTAQQRVVCQVASDTEISYDQCPSGAFFPSETEHPNVMLWVGLALEVEIYAPLNTLFGSIENPGLISKVYSVLYSIFTGPKNEGPPYVEAVWTDYSYSPDPMAEWIWRVRMWVPIFDVPLEPDSQPVEIGTVTLTRGE